MVLDKDDKFIGLVGKAEYDLAIVTGDSNISYVSDIMNRNCVRISDENPYVAARNIFSEKQIDYIPVVDKENNLVDIFSRRRAFWRQFYMANKLPRMNYAFLVWTAASEAVKLGLKAISVIEFGVAGGNGLLSLQFHAREIGRLLNLEIQVYGFDTGEGLPVYQKDYKDILCVFKPFMCNMDYQELEEKLKPETKLVLGDIHNTVGGAFLKIILWHLLEQ